MTNEIVLVTGGRGLVGKGIELALNDPKYNLKCDNETWIFCSSKDANLLNLNECDELFNKYKPTKVIHLAAKVGGLYHNMRNNLGFFRENMAINDNVLACAHKYNVQKVVSCLSTCIYPDIITYPLDETKVHDGAPHDSNFGYSYAKRMITVLNKLYNVQHGRFYTSVIPTNVYGPYDNYNLQDGHVLPGLIHKTYIAKRDNQPLTIWGTGAPLRQFIYSIDLGRLLIWSMRHYDSVEPILLTDDEEKEVSIKSLADMIVKAMGFEGKLLFDTSKSDGQFKKTASNKKLRSLLKDFEFTPMEKGVQDTCTWFCENYETLRK